MNRIILIFIACILACGPNAYAQDISDFLDMSLEELVDISIVSATKKEQKISEAPAIISIITQQ
ncbi:MAG: hypothetical protein HOC20_09060 [Chloroflexi bacterium]|jgi:outer membrane receptor for ferrienterochelin and colicin|nr:hypothetical protein [Chloroflexota bacterium]